MPERHWTAVKITQFGHGVCSSSAQLCDCATGDDSWAIVEEQDRSGESDTSRFLVAGAMRSLWVRTKQGNLAEAMPAFRKQIADAENTIIESNSVMKFLRPDLYISVLDYQTGDFKNSARDFLDRASAVILHEAPHNTVPAWSGVSLKLLQGKPVFRVSPPQYVSDDVISFVREQLSPQALIRE